LNTPTQNTKRQQANGHPIAKLIMISGGMNELYSSSSWSLIWPRLA
jgi:hypothetical protein